MRHSSTPSNSSLFSVEGSDLTDRVHRHLSLEIAEGHLIPGQQLLETALARELGVSRTPVREALRLLVSEGLAMATPEGVAVTDFTVKDVRDLLQTEQVLDGLACRLAVANGTDRQMERLEEIMVQMEIAERDDDISHWRDADRQLHEQIALMADNQPLARFSVQVSTLLGRMRQLSARLPGRPHEANLENRRVVDALKRRDGAEAEQAMQEHVRNVEQAVVGILENFVVPFKGERF